MKAAYLKQEEEDLELWEKFHLLYLNSEAS